MKFLLAVTLCVCIAMSSLFAQENYQKGLVVVSGDTLRGYIDVKEWEKNPSTINYKSDLSASGQRLRVPSLEYFEVPGYAVYETHIVKITMAAVSANQTKNFLEAPAKVDTVLLNVLFKGRKLTLYSYEDNIKIRFFVKSADQKTPEELYYELYKDFYKGPSKEGYMTVERTGFKNQLAQYARQYNEFSRSLEVRIQKAKYLKHDILQLVQTINGTETKAVVQVEQASYKKQSTGFYIGVAGSMDRFRFSSASIYHGQEGKNSKYSILGVVGYDMAFKPRIGKLFFRYEATFGHTSYYNTYTSKYAGYSEFAMKQYDLGLSINVLYNVYNGNVLKVRAGGGGRVDFGFNQEGYMRIGGTIYNPSFLAFWMSVNAKAAVMFKDHYEFAVSYLPRLSNITTFNNGETKPYSLSLGLNYHF